ncbi:dTMP kinase [Spirulina sp. CS-785/01]|uniref:dTMP kinase n=1 Tax=Spirulina sp. CS-785/01 TaxID=3021716 RepID=UPI0023311186|nr:dTMP kinase [Spirulina sp. CS-785/01]MDB9312440.1 dTMP kinase [Spirulina sp. CS-785/01]
MTGKFIVFEGGEGAGKTTQIQYTEQWLKQQCGEDFPVLVTREPGGTDLGQHLRHLLLEQGSPQSRTELLLYAADRAQHVEEILKPALSQGTVILCDRYTDSTIAYQGYGRGLDLDLIQTLNFIATGGLESHLTLWLDVPVPVGLDRAQQRGKRDRIEQTHLNFHHRVHQGFLTLSQQHPHRITRINANPPPQLVHQQIKEKLRFVVGC